MSQPEPFPHTTPPSEATPPTRATAGNAIPETCTDAPTTSSALPVEFTTGGRYEVLRFHAKGGMGEVSVALDRELQREVAFKQIQPRFSADGESKRRFVLEAEVTGRLEHPGIVPIYGLGVQSDGRPYYAMRFIQGDSLREAIQAFHGADQPGRDPGERELALRGLLRRFIDVCNAVAFAHDRGWLHRDLKPANVMLGKFGETLVVDWGLARPLRSEAGEVRAEQSLFPPSALTGSAPQTRPGDVVGTPPYMSPEQARGDWDAVGVRSDVYSLGATLYELLTGKVPFEGTLSEVLEAVKAGRVVPVRQRKAGVPAALEAVVTQAMALQRETRYGTAQELAVEVERWLGDEPVTAYREPLSQRVRRWGRRHRLLVSSLAVLLLTASVALSVGLVLVNEARTATQAALGRERREKEQKVAALASATTQRKLALDTVRAVIYRIHRRLHNQPGMQELRQDLLREAEEGLTKVARAADTAAAIDREQFVVHGELGDLFLQLEKGGVVLAQEQYERGHTVAVRLAEADLKNAKAQRDLSLSLDRLGNVRLRLGETQVALDSYQQSFDIKRRLAEADPKNAQAQRDLSVSLERLGDVRLRLGDTKAALDSYQQCHDIARRLAEADPRNAQAQRDLSVSLEKLGDVRLKLGDTKAALDAYQQSLDIKRRLAEADPKNAQAQRDLSISLNKLGDVRLQLGETKVALDFYQQSHDVSRRLAEADPKNAEAQRDLSISLNRLGNVQLRLGETKAALDAYQQYHDLARRLAEADPKNAEAQRDLSISLNKLGDVRLQLGETQAALDSYQQSFDIKRHLAEADPKNAQAQRDLSVSLEKLGDVRLKLGDTKAALDAYQQYHDLARRLAEADPKNAQAQRDLSISLNKLGDVRLQLGETQAALDAYQQYHDLARRLAEADPKNAEAQRDLLVSYYKLGNLQQTQHAFAAAIAFYDKALEVPRRFPRPDLFKSEVAILETRMRLCRAADKALADPATAQNLPTPLRLQVLSAILPPLAKQKQRDKLLAVAELLAKEEKNADALYDAVCALALCIPLTDKADDKEKHALRAVALLKQALAAGYKNLAHLQKDTDLDPLRQRQDFHALVKTLEAKPPSR